MLAIKAHYKAFIVYVDYNLIVNQIPRNSCEHCPTVEVVVTIVTHCINTAQLQVVVAVVTQYINTVPL